MEEIASWLHSGNGWLIIGLLLAFVELAHGAMAFFLPMGLAGIFTGLLLKLQEAEVLPVWLPDWAWTLLFWAVASLLISLLLARALRKKSVRDINDY